MQEIKGNIWDFHNQGYFIVIPTNTTVKSNGNAVMGAGLAKQAAEKFIDLPYTLGLWLREPGGDCVIKMTIRRLFIFPTKYHWKEKSNLLLIEEGLRQLVSFNHVDNIYLPRIGCGLGGLNWDKVVKPLCEQYLDDRFIIVS